MPVKKDIDKSNTDRVSLSERQTVVNRLYGHRQTLRSLLAETERIIEWLQKNKV